MVAPKTTTHPAGDAVGLLPDGKINIGTSEEMRERFERGSMESEAATEAVQEDGDEWTDEDDEPLE